MSYEIEVIKKDQLQVSKWSGGTTTQLAIYPLDAIYSEHNFIWRLSSAKVLDEESIFTSLPNINRIIMIIEGKLILEHVGHYKRILEKFDQDKFSGSWKTKSLGKVIDFNLMMTEDCEGKLEAIHLENGQCKNLLFNRKKAFSKNLQAIYCISGTVEIKVENEVFSLHEGDIILVTSTDNSTNQSLKVINKDVVNVDLISININF